MLLTSQQPRILARKQKTSFDCVYPEEVHLGLNLFCSLYGELGALIHVWRIEYTLEIV